MCKRKIRNKSGFTLAESLVAILIMLMVSSILVAGIPAAKNAYDKVILRSNAEMALSTAIYALRNEMTVASDIKLSQASGETEDTTIEYTSGTYGSQSKIYLNTSGEDKWIMYQRYTDSDGGKDSSPTRLVSEHASDSNHHLYVTYERVTLDRDNNFITFHNLKVCQHGKNDGAGNPKAILNRGELSVTIL